MRTIWLGLAVLAMGTGLTCAQAPAGAPAGANGICKDGTYSTSAKKEGACRGHKGVQTWYAAATAPAPAPAAAAKAPAKPAASAPAPAAPAPTAAKAPAAMPAPTPMSAPQSKPAPTMPTAAPAAAPAPSGSSKRLSPTQAAAAKPTAPGGGPGLVWVNMDSKVYHCNGDAFYGKTKSGKYMSEADAQAMGAHGERNKTCAGK